MKEEITEQQRPTEKLSARVPPVVFQSVEEIAARHDRTISYVTRRLVEIGLQHVPRKKGVPTLTEVG
jgi:hypothetical protein